MTGTRPQLWIWAMAGSAVVALGAVIYLKKTSGDRVNLTRSDASTRSSRIHAYKEVARDTIARPSTDAAPPSDIVLPQFVDVAQEVGINFSYVRGETGQFWPVEPVGGGAGWLDYDGDGSVDLILVDGAQLPVSPSERFVATRLFRNLHGQQFEDVTIEAGLLCHDYGQGCAVADFDNYGFGDLYVTNYGGCALFRNNGDGTFLEMTEQAGVPGGEWNTGACFADFNRDGILDLYVAGYFHFTPEGYQSCRSSKGKPEYCGPSDSPALPDFLYQGRGDGTFEDVSAVFGSVRLDGPGFGGVGADLDNDGWPELYVANDAWANFLFHNVSKGDPNGSIRLEEVGYRWGGDVNADGVPQASMGLACADFDRNDFLDLAVT